MTFFTAIEFKSGGLERACQPCFWETDDMLVRSLEKRSIPLLKKKLVKSIEPQALTGSNKSAASIPPFLDTRV